MTIEQALSLIDETILALRQRAVLAEGDDEIRAEAAVEVLERVAAAMREG